MPPGPFASTVRHTSRSGRDGERSAFERAAATARHSREPAAYRAAVELYVGDLLPEDRYEPWAEERREQLRRSHLALLLELAGLLEEGEEYGSAIEALRRAATEEPTREEVHAILMRLYDYEGHLAAARGALGETAFDVAFSEGRAMPLEQAIEYALSRDEEPHTLVAGQQPLADEPTERLTSREREVVVLVAQGLTNRQIASELSVSEHTVGNHVGRILKKLGFSSRALIAAWIARR